MPLLQVKLGALASSELTAQVAAVLTELTTQVLHKQPQVVAVVVDYHDPAHWVVGGKTLAEQGLASFFLDIKITDGTNTKDEKAAYQQQVFDRLAALLGPLHPVSYVYVHDARAEAYGYGGRSQEQRYIQGKLGASSPAELLGSRLHVPT